MQKDVWIDVRSLSRPFITGWERYVHHLSLILKNHSNIKLQGINSSNRVQLLFSDLSWPRHSKEFKVSHFPTYPPLYKSKSHNQIITVHDLTWLKYPDYSSKLGKYYYSRFFIKAIQESDGIIVPSESIKNDLLTIFPKINSNIEIIAHGNSLPKGIKSKNSKPYFLSIGTVEPRKNLNFYADAIKKSNLLNNFDFIHVGRDGWDEIPKIFKRVQVINNQDLANMIANAHCVVIPSIYEGFGLPVIESHSQIKNVLMSNDPALLELKSKNDLVFELGNLDSLVEKLQEGATKSNDMEDSEIQDSNKYSWQVSVEKHLKFYERFYV